jgi:hypothetical protein
MSVVPAGPGTILYTSTVDVKPTGSITFGNSLHPTGMTMEANSNAVLRSHATGNPILVAQLDSFTPSAGSKFDLTNNEMLVSQPLATVRGELSAGNMITTAAGRALGYGDHGGGVTEVLATLLGDSDLDGTVNVADLANLAGNFGNTTNQLWINGDFDYNSNVNVADLADLAGNFGQSLGGGGATAATAVPAAMTGSAATSNQSKASVTAAPPAAPILYSSTTSYAPGTFGDSPESLYHKLAAWCYNRAGEAKHGCNDRLAPRG